MTDRGSATSLRILGPRARLLGTGDGDSLENVNTTELPNGSSCWVIASRAEFRLYKDDNTTPPDGTNIIRPASGPGRWFIQVNTGTGIQVENMLGLVLPQQPLLQTEGLHPVNTGTSIQLLDGEVDALAFPSLSAAVAANSGRTIRLINTTHVVDASLTDDTVTFRMLEGAVLQIGGNKTLACRLNCTNGGTVQITAGTPIITSEIIAHPQAKIFDVTAASMAYRGTFDIYVNWWGVNQPDDGATCLAAVLSIDHSGTLPRPRRIACAGDLSIVTPFYLTKFRGSGIVFDFTGSHLTVVDPTHTKVGIDFADSIDITTLNLWVTGDTTNYPRVGMLLSRNNNEEPVAGVPRVAGRHVHFNPRVDGAWGLCAHYNCGSEVNRIFGGIFQNTLSTAKYGGFFGRVNIDNVVSNDPTVAVGNGSGPTPTTASGAELYGTRFFCLDGNVAALYILCFSEISSFETFNVSGYRQLVLDSRDFGMSALRFYDYYGHNGTLHPNIAIEIVGNNLHNIEGLRLVIKTALTTTPGTQIKLTFDPGIGAGLSGLTHSKIDTEAAGDIVCDPDTLIHQSVIDTRGAEDVVIVLGNQCRSSEIYMGSRASLTPAASMGNTIVMFDPPGGGVSSDESRRLHFAQAGPTLIDQNSASPPTGLLPGEGRIWSGRAGALAVGVFPLLRWESLDSVGTVNDHGVVLNDRLLINEGLPVSALDFSLSPAWGDTATVSNVRAGSNDTRGRISITANGAGIGSNPSVTFTFPSVWPTTPFPQVERQDNSAPTTGHWVLGGLTDSSMTYTFLGTPQTGTVYTLAWHIID